MAEHVLKCRINDWDTIADGRKRIELRRQLSGAHTADSWNEQYPVGTAVRYWPIYPPIPSVPPVDTTTRSEAWTLGDGSAVVSIAGRCGGVSLAHLEVIQKDCEVSDSAKHDSRELSTAVWLYDQEAKS